MVAKIIKAPESLYDTQGGYSVFLSGSIEMGTAENWQVKMERALSRMNIIILNPRRDDWDDTWVQSITDQRFKEQVEWELEAMNRASVIAMYFHPDTKAPITLLELGINTHTPGKLVVCCPDGFYRKGNVEIVCANYDITLVDNFEEFIAETILRLQAIFRGETGVTRR